MWTNENRGRYDRSRLRYPSDLMCRGPRVRPAAPSGERSMSCAPTERLMARACAGRAAVRAI
jgi:hypothetical protein